jgi:hypothetical protein
MAEFCLGVSMKGRELRVRIRAWLRLEEWNGFNGLIAVVGLVLAVAALLVAVNPPGGSASSPSSTPTAVSPPASIASSAGTTTPPSGQFGVDLIAGARAAHWSSSGSPKLPFDPKYGPDVNARVGRVRYNKDLTLDGGEKIPFALEATPPFIQGGWVQGRFDLHEPVSGGHLIVRMGTLENPGAGEVSFKFSCIWPNTSTHLLADVHDYSDDNGTPDRNFDLTACNGATAIEVRITALSEAAEGAWTVLFLMRIA